MFGDFLKIINIFFVFGTDFFLSKDERMQISIERLIDLMTVREQWILGLDSFEYLKHYTMKIHLIGMFRWVHFVFLLLYRIGFHIKTSLP